MALDNPPYLRYSVVTSHQNNAYSCSKEIFFSGAWFVVASLPLTLAIIAEIFSDVNISEEFSAIKTARKKHTAFVQCAKQKKGYALEQEILRALKEKPCTFAELQSRLSCDLSALSDMVSYLIGGDILTGRMDDPFAKLRLSRYGEAVLRDPANKKTAHQREQERIARQGNAIMQKQYQRQLAADQAAEVAAKESSDFQKKQFRWTKWVNVIQILLTVAGMLAADLSGLLDWIYSLVSSVFSNPL